MNNKSLILLVLLIIVAGASILFGRKQKSTPNAKLFPDFDLNQINLTEKLIIQNNKTTVTLEKNNKDIWQIKEESDYPADVVKIRKLLVALSEAEKIEQKVLRDLQYPELGLALPSSATGTGTQLDIYIGDLHYALIAGNSAPSFNNSQYIRLMDNGTSWLINRNLDLVVNSSEWLDRQIVHINPEDIYKMHITRSGYDAIDIIRSEKGEKLDLLGAGAEQKKEVASIITGLASIPEHLQFTDVIPRSEKTVLPDNAITIEYITFDGLKISYTSYIQEADGDEKYYAIFTASVNENIASSEEKQRIEMQVEILSEIYTKWYFTTTKSVYDTASSQLDKLKIRAEAAQDTKDDDSAE